MRNIEEATSGTAGTDDIQAELQLQMSRVREGLAEADLRLREVVREHPVASVLGAVALGYLVGRLTRRV